MPQGPKTIFFAAMMLALITSPQAGHAADDNCNSCAFSACIATVIAQKEAILKVYQELSEEWDEHAKGWGGYWVKTVSGLPVSRDVIDLKAFGPDWGPVLKDINRRHEEFMEREGQLIAAIGAPAGCGFPPGEDIDMETDTVQCVIDKDKADIAKQKMPCKELFDIAYEHERFHRNQCTGRRGDAVIPMVRQTPAGKAREEVQAYTDEITKLKRVSEQSLNESFLVTLKPPGVKGGLPSLGTVTLKSRVPADGEIRIQLKSDKAAAAVPSHVTVAPGSKDASFEISTTPVPSNTFAFISASCAGSGMARSAQISVRQPRLVSIVIPPVLTSKQEFTGTVAIDGKAPQDGFLIKLRPQKKPGGYLTYPGTVTVGAGENTAEFRGEVGLVPSARSGHISAEGGGAVFQANTWLKP